MNNIDSCGTENAMKQFIPYTLAAVLVLSLTTPASAACYADYKAKRDNPLRLHYGVIEVSDAVCQDKSLAAQEVKPRLKDGDWKLLNIVSVFGKGGLNKRKESAGNFFLRY